MLKLHLLLPVFLVPFSIFAQLDVEAPIAEETPEPAFPENVDEEAVRSLTRQIQATVRQPGPSPVVQDHPGKRHYEKVMERLQSVPTYLAVRIDLQNGKTFSAEVANQLLTIQTDAGPLPVHLSELVEMSAGQNSFHFTFHGNDGIRGVPREEVLPVERADSSLVIVPLRSIQRLRMVTEEKP
jgi:hypothetical protein